MKDISRYFLITTIILALGYYLFKIIMFNQQANIEIIGKFTKDFGNIEKNSVVEHFFVFTNSGEKDLLIYNVETTCGCTASSWNKKPVKKNKIDSIKVSYDSNIIGEFDKPIFIYSNSEEKQITLRIKGEIID